MNLIDLGIVGIKKIFLVKCCLYFSYFQIRIKLHNFSNFGFFRCRMSLKILFRSYISLVWLLGLSDVQWAAVPLGV